MNESGVWIFMFLLCLLVMFGLYSLYGLLSANAPIGGWINGDDESD